MLLAVFSVASVEALSIPLSTSALLGYSLLASLIVVILLSSQRWLLWYVFGGIAYWSAIELIHSGLMIWSALDEWHGYVAAMGLSWLPLFAWVLYRALRYEDISKALAEERALAAARYVEHSPIYDDDYRPRFQ